MIEKLYLKLDIEGQAYLIGELKNENNVKFTFNYISDPKGVAMDFKKVQYLPLSMKEYVWYGVPEAFDEMIISPRRPDLPMIMKLLKMDKYDPWEYIKRTEGRSDFNYWFFQQDDRGIRVNMIS